MKRVVLFPTQTLNSIENVQFLNR